VADRLKVLLGRKGRAPEPTPDSELAAPPAGRA
jgi:hypothetical protein